MLSVFNKLVIELPFADLSIVAKKIDIEARNDDDIGFQVLTSIYKPSPKRIMSSLPTQIGFLDLESSRIIDDDLRHLTGIIINYLNLRTRITNNGLKYLHCCNINKLKLWAPYITDNGLRYLANINILELRDGYNITDNGLQHLSNIKDVSFIDCPRITNRGLMYLTTTTVINISSINVDSNIRRSLSSLRNLNLNSISIQMYDSTKNIDIRYLINSPMQTIALYGYITLKQLKCLGGIKNIYFNYCVKIDRLGLKYLTQAENIFLIGYLNLLTLSDIQSIPNIKTLHLVNNKLSDILKKSYIDAGIKIYEYDDE